MTAIHIAVLACRETISAGVRYADGRASDREEAVAEFLVVKHVPQDGCPPHWTVQVDRRIYGDYLSEEAALTEAVEVATETGRADSRIVLQSESDVRRPAGTGKEILSGRERRIRERAYALWRADGCLAGRDREHWLRAERDIADEEMRAAHP
jgi:Protein of unknown function (DUF2934)